MSARAHFQAVFGDQTGWVFIGIGSGQYVTDSGKVDHKNWDEKSFRWPAQTDEITAKITEATEAGADVYFTPSLSSNPVRKKTKNPKHSRKPLPVRVLWSDLDGDHDVARLFELYRHGGCWRTSSGSAPTRGHLYVPLIEPAEPAVAEDLLRRLAAWLGSDPAPTWHGSFLRPVGSKNWKPTALTAEPPGHVRFDIEPCDAVWTIEDLDDLLPAVEHSPVDAAVPEAETVGPLTADLTEILAETVTAGMDRSTRTLAAVGACVRAGLSDGQVITVMRGHAPTVEKYDGRADAEVTRALGKVRAQEPVTIGERQTDDFWTARDELRHIRTYAQAQMACPLAVLAMVLARVVCQAPAAVVLPDIIHDHASLNLTIALVGISGGGKGGATGVARRAVDIGTPNFDTHTLGSGQGIAHGYGHWDKDARAVVRHADSVLFTVDEVDHIAGHNAQNGSTTLAELRRFSMGEKLGHLYVDPTRRVQIAPHTYRGATVVSVQPARASVLLDAIEGGTPQRFWWVPTIDHNPPDLEPDRPEPRRWQLPSSHDLPPVEPSTGLRPIPVCDTARTAIRDAQRARNRGEGDPLDGHSLLTRERIAAALGLLHGHYGITDEDWTLAGMVMAISDTTRVGVVAALVANARTVNTARAHAEADRDEVKEDRQDQRVARLLLEYLRRRGDWVNRSDLRVNAVASRDRLAFESAVAKLIAAGVVEPEEITGQGQRPGIRYRVVER